MEAICLGFSLQGSNLEFTRFRHTASSFRPAMASAGDSSSVKISSKESRRPRPRSRLQQPWWTPLFKNILEPSGKDGDHDYDEDEDVDEDDYDPARVSDDNAKSPAKAKSNSRPRRSAAVFTEEKARRLRRELRDTEILHDHMYHSAIASRLAFPDDDE